jgi:hypothetical protein
VIGRAGEFFLNLGTGVQWSASPSRRFIARLTLSILMSYIYILRTAPLTYRRILYI